MSREPDPSKSLDQLQLGLADEEQSTVRGGGFLQGVRWRDPDAPRPDGYPYQLPAFRALERIAFHPAVTFLVGENGSGKSTLLEALAVKLGFNAEGGSRNFSFATRETHSELHAALRLERSGHFTDGWFLRAESFYNVATQIEELGVVGGYGGVSPHAQSHGESFLALLSNRLRGHGLYLLDEPEAALSPQRQLGALLLLHRLVQRRSQFIIATHSPMLLAYPQARILELGEHGIREVAYRETEAYQVTRDFLNAPERMLALLGLDRGGRVDQDA